MPHSICWACMPGFTICFFLAGVVRKQFRQGSSSYLCNSEFTLNFCDIREVSEIFITNEEVYYNGRVFLQPRVAREQHLFQVEFDEQKDKSKIVVLHCKPGQNEDVDDLIMHLGLPGYIKVCVHLAKPVQYFFLEFKGVVRSESDIDELI
ncbi:MAG: hypothetical protein EZS28_024780 [Streblomastix strix]|uniref:Uncharacterized protein n=1 Tax=Streblomastix strix TaxID=222440 RepID=A0A5J4VB59_9EUKA|nr:MAG: hypothetical protein EZS28_024780 [Streblomastix strix]